MQIPHLGIRTRLRTAMRRLGDIPYYVRARGLRKGHSGDYRRYIGVQLNRTLAKRDNDPGVGARLLVEGAASAIGRRGQVLCVGCRNTLELERFRALGVEDVTGIDLFSTNPDIQVMDMHELAFAEGSFDAVYSSHSLEHAYDVERVADELTRVVRDRGVVAVEVPLGTPKSAADRVEFRNLHELRSLFGNRVGETLLAETLPANSERNEQGTEVARLVFRVTKTAVAEEPRPRVAPRQHAAARRRLVPT